MGRATSITLFCNSNNGKVTLNSLKKENPNLFYPQDWYDKEPFMNKSFKSGEYTVPNHILNISRGKSPYKQKLYPASLITYIFITYYKTTGIILWQNDYIWCNDFDSNEDQIYVGRYYDPLGISKDGFSIHRHLTIKENYGWL
tara:strand:- start:4250 stop:4678 length:429 start_codon:yes stop_codon:yes gene_type:complete